MKRYEKNKTKIDKDGKRVYTTTYYPKILNIKTIVMPMMKILS